MSEEVPLTNPEANELAAKVEAMGGRLIDHQPCKACKNYTLALLPYTPSNTRRETLTTLCLWCDMGKRWPRLEQHEEPDPT